MRPAGSRTCRWVTSTGDPAPRWLPLASRRPGPGGGQAGEEGPRAGAVGVGAGERRALPGSELVCRTRSSSDDRLCLQAS